MKKLYLVAILLTVTNLVFAQDKPEKGSVAKAESSLNSGDLADAKTEIDNAIAYEIYKLESKGKPAEVKPKSLYVKGQVYAAIAMSSDEAVKSLVENPLSEAVDALNQVMEVEKEGSVYYTFAEQKKQDLYANLFNKAVEYYNAEDMEGALRSFEQVNLVSPGDTSALQNAVSIAYELKKEDKVVLLGTQLIENDFTKPYLYRMIAQYDIERGKQKDQDHKEGKSPEAEADYEKALKVLQAGQDANPEDADISTTVFQLYRRLDKMDEALASLDKSIEISPDNKALYLQKGFLLDEIGKLDEAIASYNKATELDPNYFDAYYSIGRIYYNRGAEISKELNNLELDKYGRPKDKKKYEELEGKMLEQFKLSLPSFEKAYSINSEDQDVIAILARVYSQLEMKDKYEEMAKKMKD